MRCPSLIEIDKAALGAAQLLRSNEGKLEIIEEAALLRDTLERLLTSDDIPIAKISQMIATFRSNLGLADPCYQQNFVGAVAGYLALREQGVDRSVADEFGPQFHSALDKACADEEFMAEEASDNADELHGQIDTLLHAAIALMNFAPERTSAITQQDIDHYLYDAYFHLIKMGVYSDLWIHVHMCQARAEIFDLQDGETGYEEALRRAHAFTNIFFNFLCQVSDHPRCSRALRTVIRTHLISFHEDESEKLPPELPFDIGNIDLRVTFEDIRHTNDSSGFHLNEQRLATPLFCRDA
ncbi:hypothetical protein HY213_03910 [Candidatus Peregrinibacteria bacterium]|nr:hypothetical protein [Candidatus Peregrinibacteria bacterium]